MPRLCQEAPRRGKLAWSRVPAQRRRGRVARWPRGAASATDARPGPAPARLHVGGARVSTISAVPARIESRLTAQPGNSAGQLLGCDPGGLNEKPLNDPLSMESSGASILKLDHAGSMPSLTLRANGRRAT